MYIIFDTETTTFPNPNYSAHHPAQARIIQLAALVLDSEFNEINSLYSFVKPAGWKISEGAFAAHGISMAKCEELGRPIRDIMSEFELRRDSCEYDIAHNIGFDNQMLNIEREIVVHGPYKDNAEYCTMELMTNICKLPHKSSRGNRFGNKYKWPKLAEAYEYCFHEPFTGAHDSMQDVRATAKIFKWLVDNKFVNINNKIESI